MVPLQEIAVLRSLSYDRNLVQFYGACLEREHAMLVLEYMEGGDLYQAIQENSYPVDTRLLSWYQKGGTIALDIAKGLVYLHQNNVSCTTSQLWLLHTFSWLCSRKTVHRMLCTCFAAWSLYVLYNK